MKCCLQYYPGIKRNQFKNSRDKQEFTKSSTITYEAGFFN